LAKVSPLPQIETPEALYLGLRPDEAQLRQGPLTVAALGADPPPRSTHFHLSVLSHTDGKLTNSDLGIPAAQAQIIEENAKRLNTKLLTFVKGSAKDHALVWEGLGDLGMHNPTAFADEPMKDRLPEGDAESMLRRYIDDSINLLSEMEFNERRIDEGLPPFNVLWPWGDGVRTDVPNLAIRRGAPATVESASLRLAGLSYLVGYRHGDRDGVGQGVRTRLAALAERMISGDQVIAVLEGPQELRRKGQLEELEWFVSEFDQKLLSPLLEASLKDESRISLISPGPGLGLALKLHAVKQNNSTPFDERALEERTVPTSALHALVEQALVG